jgi:hypothetical protein
MTSAIQTPNRPPAAAPQERPKSTQELRSESERLRDVLVLLESITRREEAAIKLILDSLYEIGAVNFANSRVRHASINPLFKMMARMAKPAFRFFAWRWFKHNCPQLIAEWLYSQVSGELATANGATATHATAAHATAAHPASDPPSNPPVVGSLAPGPETLNRIPASLADGETLASALPELSEADGETLASALPELSD